MSRVTNAKRESLQVYLRKNYEYYLLLAPALFLIGLFRYVPMYGLIIAFRDFNIFRGIYDSPSVGLYWFRIVFSDTGFIQVLINTLLISSYKIVYLFPLPILLALLLNEVKSKVFKRFIQTVIYLPHFLSWVIVSGLFLSILGSDGVVNRIIEPWVDQPIRFLMDRSLFRSLLVVTEGWKTIGWSAIVYLAAIAGIDPQLYEAAVVDGANKLDQALYVTLPGISPTVFLLLILRLGNILEAGFGQIIVMYNPTVYPVADIIGTYVYRIGLGQMRFSYGTAVGIFNSAVSFIMIVCGNAIARRFLGRSIW